MKMDILAILMVAFCLFAIAMFVLFYVYAKKYRNEKNISEDYKKFDDEEANNSKDKIELIDIMINGKDYVFESNGYQLYSGDEVNVLINDNIFTGIVTKSNYKDDVYNYTQIPTKLILEEKKKIDEDDLEIKNYDDAYDNNEKSAYNYEDTQINSNEDLFNDDEEKVNNYEDIQINSNENFSSDEEEFVPVKKND